MILTLIKYKTVHLQRATINEVVTLHNVIKPRRFSDAKLRNYQLLVTNYKKTLVQLTKGRWTECGLIFNRQVLKFTRSRSRWPIIPIRLSPRPGSRVGPFGPQGGRTQTFLLEDGGGTFIYIVAHLFFIILKCTYIEWKYCLANLVEWKRRVNDSCAFICTCTLAY